MKKKQDTKTMKVGTRQDRCDPSMQLGIKLGRVPIKFDGILVLTHGSLIVLRKSLSMFCLKSRGIISPSYNSPDLKLYWSY